MIVWFIDKGGKPSGLLSGLFDYANIAGAWLAVIWPFCLAALIQPYLNVQQRAFVFTLTVALVVALVLTDSRNAWGGLILAVPFVLGPTQWLWLLPLLMLLLILWDDSNSRNYTYAVLVVHLSRLSGRISPCRT